MLRRHVTVPMTLLALAAPAVAHAQTGGAEAGGQTGPGIASASDGTVSVSTRTGGLVGRRKTFTGSIPAGDGGRTVTVERFDDLSGQWSPIAYATADDKGAYAAHWRPDRSGAARVRARVQSPDATAAAAAPEVAITLYEPAKATYYGPGFYGRKTACGQKLTTTLQGVAHRTLRCGRKVALLYRGRTVTVPVVDRGPFANGATYDLTGATAKSLGLNATARIGALPSPQPASR